MNRTSIVFIAIVATSACGQSVRINVPQGTTAITVNGAEPVEVNEGSAEVEVPMGVADVDISLLRDETPTQTVSVARENTALPYAAGGLCGAAACAPTCAAVGFGVANWGVLIVPPAALVAAATPTLLTLPCTLVGGACGLLPLGLLFLGERIPDEVTLPPSAPGRQSDFGTSAQTEAQP